jgi:predicted small secreted protein
MMKKTIALLLAAWVLAGCNTMEGLGKDIQKGGEKLEKAANK